MEGFNSTENRDRSQNQAKVKLASREAMLNRLLDVNDEATFQKLVYPYLLQVAGEELPAVAVAGIITLAIDRVTQGDRFEPSSQLVRLFVPHIIDAAVETPQDREAVLAILSGR